MDYVRSALFLDFDNIYIRLKDMDPGMAESFATEPGNWLSWLEHAKFGEGRIIQAEGDKLTVAFQRQGIKKLMKRFLTLA